MFEICRSHSHFVGNGRAFSPRYGTIPLSFPELLCYGAHVEFPGIPRQGLIAGDGLSSEGPPRGLLGLASVRIDVGVLSEIECQVRGDIHMLIKLFNDLKFRVFNRLTVETKI